MDHQFGIKDLPTNPKLWWGARGILERSNNPLAPRGKKLRKTRFLVTFLPDRQSFYMKDSDGKVSECPNHLHPEERKEMVDWFNAKGQKLLLQEMDRVAMSKFDNIQIQLQSEGYCIIANPKRSGGYLYVSCYKA